MSTPGAAGKGRTWAAPRVPLRVAFLAAACSLVFVFAAAGTPIPLYNTYRAEDGITNADLGIVSVGYFVAAATSLLVFGRLSNHLGRRPVALAALTSAAVACLLLIGMDGVLPLLVARVLQGLACGLASSGLGSYVIDSAPERPRWLPAAITGSAPMLGIPIGALACGALVRYGPAPRVLIYEIMTAVLVVCAALMAMSPETMPRRRGAMASLRPRLQVPAGSGQLLLAAGAASVATWSLGGFYQAFGPSVAAEHLGTTNPLVAAAVFASVMVLNPVGGPLSGRLRARDRPAGGDDPVRARPRRHRGLVARRRDRAVHRGESRRRRRAGSGVHGRDARPADRTRSRRSGPGCSRPSISSPTAVPRSPA